MASPLNSSSHPGPRGGAIRSDLMSLTAKVSTQALVKDRGGQLRLPLKFAPTLNTKALSPTCHLPATITEPLKERRQMPRPSPCFWGLGLRWGSVGTISPRTPTLMCPRVSPCSHGFCPSHPGLVAHRERTDLGTQCNLLIPSTVPPPSMITHTWKGNARVWAGTKPRPGQKNIYNYIHIHIWRGGKLGM